MPSERLRVYIAGLCIAGIVAVLSGIHVGYGILMAKAMPTGIEVARPVAYILNYYDYGLGAFVSLMDYPRFDRADYLANFDSHLLLSQQPQIHIALVALAGGCIAFLLRQLRMERVLWRVIEDRESAEVGGHDITDSARAHTGVAPNEEIALRIASQAVLGVVGTLLLAVLGNALYDLIKAWLFQ